MMNDKCYQAAKLNSIVDSTYNECAGKKPINTTILSRLAQISKTHSVYEQFHKYSQYVTNAFLKTPGIHQNYIQL